MCVCARARGRVFCSVCVVGDNLDFIFGVPKHELETFYYLMRNLLDLKIKFYMKIQTMNSNILLIKKPKKKKKNQSMIQEEKQLKYCKNII